MTNRGWTISSIAIALLVGISGIQDSRAQAPGFKRVELQRQDLPTGGLEAVMARAEFDPAAVVPRHTHPGVEVGYVVQGEVVIEIDGKPPLKLKAGDSFLVPAGQVHSAKNAGKAAAAVVSTYVIEKGKPLASPAK